MVEIVASVSRRGQVTIPERVRRHLGRDAPGNVAFVLGDDGTVVIEPALTVADLRGILPVFPNTSDGFEKEIEEAMAEHADRLMAKMRHQ